MGSAHYLIEVNVISKFNDDPFRGTCTCKGDMELAKPVDPLIVTLTLSLHVCVMGSAHHLTEMNI